MKWRIAAFVVLIVLVLGIWAGLVLLAGTRGGLAYFSPYTLEYQVQSEFAILNGNFPIYRSPRRDVDNELVTFLRQEGFVPVEQPEVQRWELIFHWNAAWRDGFGPLYDVFVRYRMRIIEWSRADPERARIYWTEGFKHLRSGKKVDVWTGYRILETGWRSQSIPELQEHIAAAKRDIAGLRE